MTNYTTIQCDTWDSIAYRLWGHEHMMDTLLRANANHADVLIFPEGVVLDVPDVELPVTFQPTGDLPPWM